ELFAGASVRSLGGVLRFARPRARFDGGARRERSLSQNGGMGHGPQPPRAPGRPGAMTMAMQAANLRPTGPTVRRIGVMQGGKIVEERIVRKRETVTVGSSERNHFVIASGGLSSRFELFQLVGGDYILNFTDTMSGRVGLPAGVQSLEQLRTTGAARNA